MSTPPDPGRREPHPTIDCADQLEPLIAERTAELARVNEELAEANADLLTVNTQLEQIATIDALTQLANRRHFDDRLEQEWNRSLRAGESLALLLCDVDFFKGYNDLYGHLAGDDCLRLLAETLQTATARPGDLVARFGGEEFAVLLPGTDEAGAMALAGRIQDELKKRRIPHGGSRVSPFLTVSIGAASWTPEPGASRVVLIAAADQALYGAKAGGRDRCVSWKEAELSTPGLPEPPSHPAPVSSR